MASRIYLTMMEMLGLGVRVGSLRVFGMFSPQAQNLVKAGKVKDIWFLAEAS